MFKIRTDIPGFMDARELYQLALWTSQYTQPYNTLVECGSLAGRSSYTIAANCAAHCDFYCYDRFTTRIVPPFLDRRQPGDFWENTGQIRVGDRVDFGQLFARNLHGFADVHMIPCELPAPVTVPDRVDFFFIDLAHTNPTDRLVIEHFLPSFHRDTFICGHDYREQLFPDVVVNCAWLCELLDRRLVRGLNSMWALVSDH